MRSASLPQLHPHTVRGSWRITGASAAITELSVSPASERDSGTGLLAFIAIELDGVIRIDGLTLRRIQGGRMSLSFPSRTSRRGDRHPLVRPRDRAARAAIERTIFDALGIGLEAAR
jgi:DNA-binding cell septation regulator SpoVG